MLCKLLHNQHVTWLQGVLYNVLLLTPRHLGVETRTGNNEELDGADLKEIEAAYSSRLLMCGVIMDPIQQYTCRSLVLSNYGFGGGISINRLNHFWLNCSFQVKGSLDYYATAEGWDGLAMNSSHALSHKYWLNAGIGGVCINNNIMIHRLSRFRY